MIRGTYSNNDESQSVKSRFIYVVSVIRVLGLQDVKENYRRSALGPFWFTIAMAIQIIAISIIFGGLFGDHNNAYLPFVASGVVFWTFISAYFSEASTSVILSESIIKQLPLPIYVYPMRSLFKSFLILGHNVIVIPVLFAVVGFFPGVNSLFLVPGLVLLLLNMSWIGVLLSLLGARYRDTPPMVSAVLSIAFYATPIMWNLDQLPTGLLRDVETYNPFYILLSLAREPLLGQAIPPYILIFSTVSALIGWGMTHLVLSRVSRVVPFWV